MPAERHDPQPVSHNLELAASCSQLLLFRRAQGASVGSLQSTTEWHDATAKDRTETATTPEVILHYRRRPPVAPLQRGKEYADNTITEASSPKDCSWYDEISGARYIKG